MFTSFQQGKADSSSRYFDEGSTQYAPGRFRAHPAASKALSSAPSPRKSRANNTSLQPANDANERTWLMMGLRPAKSRVENWLSSWWKRWSILVLLPSLLVWIWVAVPFPVSETARRPTASSNQQPSHYRPDLHVDTNFYFFLFWFFGCYLACALMFVTSLFGLYRLNWWPKSLGGSISYFCFWSGSLLFGLVLHQFDMLGVRSRWDRKKDDGGSHAIGQDWERKTVWVMLAFGTMSMPALACFAKLRADRRMTYRHSLTDMQKTFLEWQLNSRIPRSYIRFLWFMVALSIGFFTLTAGQGFASIYLSTLPHTSIDGVFYVWSWIATVQLLSALTQTVLEVKVRSSALVFVFRYYFYLAYFVFYRTLFARLRSPDQYLLIQLWSSVWTVIFHPMSMSRSIHWLLGALVGYEKTHDEHMSSMAQSMYLRNLAENVTMFAFLGWLTILHFGPNVAVFPFFALEKPTADDPYNYRLTSIASLVIWATELISAFIARRLIAKIYRLDVTQVGLEKMREYPELTPALVWTSVHVLMDILFFLVKLNFR